MVGKSKFPTSIRHHQSQGWTCMVSPTATCSSNYKKGKRKTRVTDTHASCATTLDLQFPHQQPTLKRRRLSCQTPTFHRRFTPGDYNLELSDDSSTHRGGVEEARGEKRANEEEEEKKEDSRGSCRSFHKWPPYAVGEMPKVAGSVQKIPLKFQHTRSGLRNHRTVSLNCSMQQR